MEKESSETTLFCLPNELISLILQFNTSNDIINFALTCKHFNDLVQSDVFIWKEKCKHKLPFEVFKEIEKHGEINWLKELRHFYSVKNRVYAELMLMSPKFYHLRNIDDPSLQDVRVFFCIALETNVSYYYAIHVLQDIVIKGHRYINRFKASQPYTLTEIYYAKVVLRHLMHSFLAVKWVQSRISGTLYSENVLNFFMQWSDPAIMHTDEEVEIQINNLVKKTHDILKEDSAVAEVRGTIEEKCTKGLIPESKVINAVTEAIYHQRHMVVMPAANLHTLDIIKVLHDKCGGEIAVATIFQAVARRVGLDCKIIAFSKHFFLEYHPRMNTSGQPYKITLKNGKVEPKRSCPFSRNSSSNYEYCPDSFLQFVCAEFLVHIGDYRTWSSQNTAYLLEFLGVHFPPRSRNQYQNLLPDILNQTHLPAMNMTINMRYLEDIQLRFFESMFLAEEVDTPPQPLPHIPNPHDGRVKYAVGMICYHKDLNYTCVIRSWSVCCDERYAFADVEETTHLEFGRRQPFYLVTAADQSNRYIAQENLVVSARPTRLYHLEDIIAPEFTHFDGFAYVPNTEKRIEFPEDILISEMYRNRLVQGTLGHF